MHWLPAVVQPTRLQIIKLLWNEERTAGDIARAFDLTFGAISQHLRVLEAAGVVAVRREWRHRYYRARKEELGPFAESLESMWSKPVRKTRRVSKPKQNNQWPGGFWG